MEMPTGQLTILLKKSGSFIERFIWGEYKDAVIVWEINDLANRNSLVVLKYHKNAGWVLGPTLARYKRDNIGTVRVTLPYFGSPEFHTDKLLEMLGNTHWDGERLSPPKGIARLIGMPNWKKATWQSLISDSKQNF
jgi:hypothetical protein